MAGKSVNFCVFCKKKLSLNHEKYVFCLDCSPKFKIEKSKCNPEFIEKTYVKEMKHCYNCSEKLYREENAIICVECDKVRLEVDTVAIPTDKRDNVKDKIVDAVEFHDQQTAQLKDSKTAINSSHHGLDSPQSTPKQTQSATPPNTVATSLNPENETVVKDAEVNKTPTVNSSIDSHANSNDENSKTCKEDGNQIVPKNTSEHSNPLLSTEAEQKPTMQPVDLTDQPLHSLVNPVEESQTREMQEEKITFNDPPNLEIIGSLSDEVKKKWEKIGKELGLPSAELDSLQGVDYKDAYMKVMHYWQSNPSPENPFIWDVFLKILRSKVNEPSSADSIIDLLVDYPDDMESPNGSANDLASSFTLHKKASRNKNKIKQLKGSVDNCMKIHFHAVINQSSWLPLSSFELLILAKNSSGDQYLFSRLIERTRIKDLVIMERVLPILSSFVIGQHVLYKYVVKTPKNEYKSEDLCISGHKWRVLNIHPRMQEEKGTLAHYDPVILPPSSVGFFQSHLGDPRKAIMDACCKALKAYIPFVVENGWLSMENLLLSSDISNKGSWIASIFTSLKEQSFVKISKTHQKDIVAVSAESIEKVHLHELAMALQGFECMSKFYAAFIICDVLLRNLMFSKEKMFNEDINATKQILKGLFIPIHHSTACPVQLQRDDHGHFHDCVTFIKDMDPGLRDKCIVPAAHAFCKALMNHSDLHIEWMGVLPLLHEIKAISLPVSQFPVERLRVYDLLFCGLDVTKFLKRVTHESRFVNESFHLLKPYFQVNKLLAKSWIATAPYEDIVCVKNYPSITPFACWHLGINLENIKEKDKNKPEFSTILECLLLHLKKIEIDKHDEIICFKGVHKILKQFESKKTEVFKSSVKLFLTALEVLGWKDTDEYVRNCCKAIQIWFNTTYGEVANVSRMDSELQDWNYFLQLEYSDSIKKVFVNEIHKIIDYRINQLEQEDKVKLITTSGQEVYSPSLKESLVHSFLSTAKGITPVEENTWQLLSFLKLGSSTSDTLVLLGGILSTVYTDKEEVSLKSVCWKLFPMCLEIYEDCMQSNKKKAGGSAEEALAHHVCEKAKLILNETFASIHSRTIKPKQLDHIQCQFSSLEILEQFFNEFLSLKCFESIAPISFSALERELSTYKEFKQKKKKVLHFAHIALAVSGKHAAQIKKDLTSDHTMSPVLDLWMYNDDGMPQFQLNEFNIIADDIVDEVFYFTHPEGCSSAIFRKRWNNEMQRYQQKLNGTFVSIETFVKDLWSPVLSDFKSEMETLSDNLKLPLDKVTELFEGITDLESELTKWCGVFQQNTHWIRNAVQKILDYQELCYHSYAARTLLQLKETLKLSGDFNIVANLLSDQVSDGAEQVTLASVDTTAAKTAAVLKDIANHSIRRKCLEVFCSCTDLVEWIRKNAKNVGQLAEFVQIANQTMEGDLIKQLLSDLLIFGSAYAPLIYEVSADESCELLINRCKSLWTFLDKHPNLGDIAESCKNKLGEFKRMEETLTNFQRSNVEQMNLINKRGVYTVSAIPGKILRSTEDAVRLRLREDKDDHKVFELNYLKELQSKLVLVAAENAESVNKFIEILSKVERVAELVIELQEAGYVDYTHFTLMFGCSQYKRIDVEEQIEKLERSLVEWKKSVQYHRKKYPYLNYFTSQQLFILQQELGKLKKDPNSQPSIQLMLLLLSVTTQPHPSKISKAIINGTKAHTDSISQTSVQMPKIIGTLSNAQTKFSISSLDEEHKQIYKVLTAEDDYSPVVVFHAFEALGENAQVDDLRDWCMDNESQFKNEEQIPLPEDPNTLHEEVEIKQDDPLVQALLNEEYDLSVALKSVRISRATGIDVREVALGLDLGKSPELTRKSGWTVPAKFMHFPITIKVDVPAQEYLSLIELGEVLQELACTIGEQKQGLIKQRPLRRFLIESGTLNVIATDEVWKTVLFLYMEDPSLPLPTYEEVVVCTENTSIEEITLLWHRAVNDENKMRIFTLVNAEKLQFKVCEKALNNMELITQGSNDFRIALVISSQEQAKGYIVSRLSTYIRKPPNLPTDEDVAMYIAAHCRNLGTFPQQSSHLTEPERDIQNSLKSTIQVVLSTSSGMGKSLRVRRLADMLCPNKMSMKPHYVCVPIHGPEVSVMKLIEQMEACKQNPNNSYPQLIHFNISHSVIEQIDWLLFQILILGGLADSYGNVWKKNAAQICVVECTLAELETATPGMWALKQTLNMKRSSSTYTLLSLLPQTLCVSPKEVKTLYQSSRGNKVLMDDIVFKEESVQRVYQHLRRIAQKINLDTYKFLKKCQKTSELQYQVEGNPEDCLTCVLNAMHASADTINPSWAEVRNFIEFLNAQLYDCENSIFCSMEEGFPGFKQFVGRFAVMMAKEFTESSLNIGRAGHNISSITEGNVEELFSVAVNKTWDTCAHPYLFFNHDGQTMTFMGLWIDEQGSLINITDGSTIEKNYMDKQLRQTLALNEVEFMEKYSEWTKIQMLEKLVRTLGINEEEFKDDDGQLILEKIDPDETYVLTVDNLMKMLAIHMKFRCGIPVIMMGETGCGKTRLLRYLCDLQTKAFKTKTLVCLKVHGGTDEERIIQEVEKAIEQAEKNKKSHLYTVLFFDEVNTTEALGLIKEVICDRTLYGKHIPAEVKFAAACNPYRIHDEETIKSLQAAGLGFFLRDEERIPKLGTVPLRKLVYRVLPLPPSMHEYVYDFGTVRGKTEEDYIEKIVTNEILKCQSIEFHDVQNAKTVVISVINECQKYMREQKNECKYVSLRDIVRVMIVFKWFLDKLKSFPTFKDQLEILITEDPIEHEAVKNLDDIIRALIYAVSVGYYARLTKRKQFVERIVDKFVGKYSLPVETTESKTELFEAEIVRVQTTFLNSMNVPSNIAHNAALRENVFMMVVCIENRLPLFIIGKPGSSKSLAKSIVANSMQGRYSSNKLLTNFKQVQLFPYQCNQFSTTDTIIEVFQEAMEFQKCQGDFKNFASVVVLEEIGLAEDTPGLPLKVLHPYLEDGTAGMNPDDQEVKPEERVAFIGISNWALDPAKMNRCIMVTRCSPAEEELLESAYGISKMVENTQIRDELSKSFDDLAKMYRGICEKQEKYEEGMENKDEAREFFGLRDFYTMIKMLCWKCIDTNKCPTPENFREAILRNFSGHSEIDPIEYLPNASSLVSIGSSENEQLTLIQSSLEPLRVEQVKHENRYLLFITENQSALRILRTHLLKNETPYIFYGSSFPKDREYTQVCVNINKIKVCMERGIPVVLLNYEQIYESLYDVLNQCYTELRTGRYVDLGLRSYRIKCRVDPNFRLIIVAEKKRVFTQFPTALINRLEKHFVISNTILTTKQRELVKMLEEWVKVFAQIMSSFSVADAFVGYQPDTPSTCILHASQVLSEDATDDKIMEMGKFLLLQLASIDALARLRSSASKFTKTEVEKYFDTYFRKQEHFWVVDFLLNNIFAKECSEFGGLLQVTTYGPLLPPDFNKILAENLPLNEDDIHSCYLSDFSTELDFSSTLSEFFQNEKTGPKLFVVQCDSGERSADLIACARHRVQDETMKPSSVGIIHVLFIIQLVRVTGGSPFTSFQSSPWVSAHIDDLNCPRGTDEVVKLAFLHPLHKFFKILIERDKEIPNDFKVCTRIKDNIQPSAAKVVSHKTYGKMERVITILLELVTDAVPSDHDNLTFTLCLLNRIEMLFKQSDEELSVTKDPDMWAVNAALEKHNLQAHLTLVNSIRRKLDSQLQRVLSYIIARIDNNNNMSLLTAASKTHLCLRKLWLSLFSSHNFLPFYFQDMLVSKKPVIKIQGTPYSCKFPFSWEVIDQVDVVLTKIIAHSGADQTKLDIMLKELVSAFEDLAFSEHISNVLPELSLEFFHCYLDDYLHNLNLPFEEIECVLKILKNAIVAISSMLEPAINSKQPFPLLIGIACIHLAYSHMERDVFWLMELSAHNPKLPLEIVDKDVLSSGKVVFHLVAMDMAIHQVSPEGREWNNDNMKDWLRNFHLIKNVVETILNLCDEYDDQTQSIINSARYQWQKTQAIVLLAEHVVANLTDINLCVFLKRYYNLLKGLKFTEPKILTQTLRQIQGIIRKLPVKQQPKCELCKGNLLLSNVVYLPCGNNHILCKGCFKDSLLKRGPRCPSCNEPIPRKQEFPIPEAKRKEYTQLRHAQQHCMDFFMELVSQCCFSSITGCEKPNEYFLKQLLEIITDTEHEEYKELFPLDEEYSHSCPIARSVLLQELLEKNPEEVKKKLHEYQTYIKTLGTEYAVDDQELTLLCIKSLEDGLHKQCYVILGLNEQLDFATSCLQSAFSKVLKQGDLVEKYRDDIPIQYMECIAHVRFGFSFASKMFYMFYCNEDKLQELPSSTKTKLDELRSTTKQVIKKGVIKEPRDFITKQIVREYGFLYLEKLAKQTEFSDWLVEETQVVSRSIDEFVVCGYTYISLRGKWIYSNVGFRPESSMKELKDQSLEKHVAAILVLFRKAFLEKTGTDYTVLNIEDVFAIRKEIQHLHGLSEKFMNVLLGVEQFQCIENLGFTPWEHQAVKGLATIVIHFASVVAALSDKKVFTPFVTVFTQQSKLKDMFWPTMPDSPLDIVIAASSNTRDTWWKCENGHDYFIGDCGNPIDYGDEGKQPVKKCLECGAPVGGRHLKKQKTTLKKLRDIQNADLFTKHGHWLEHPAKRSSVPSPQRDLSAISNSILQLLLHSSCIWAASSQDQTICENLVEAIVQDVDIPKEEVVTFFWNHLEKDFEILCRATQLSFDECVLAVHTFIHGMLSVEIPQQSNADVSLLTREARQGWEKHFDEVFIKPFLTKMEDNVKTARECIVFDSSKDHKKLLETIYETADYKTTNIHPHLWIYRPQITVDHVAQCLQQATSDTANFELSVLNEFLRKVDLLAALQYLPDIIRLQNFLYEICNHRIDEKEAHELSIKDFLQTNIPKLHIRERLMKQVNSFCLAWNKVRKELPSLTTLSLDLKFASVEMTEYQPLAYFIPMKEGNGVCSIAVSTYLAKLQNDFIEISWKKLTKSEQLKIQVPILKLQDSQMISFKNQLTHVIFSHCKYSLKAGHGADVTYDFVALEKHILDRFVRGKPLINYAFPGMSYRNDVIEAMTFRKIRTTIEQSSITQQEKDDILNVVHASQCLQECIDVVNVSLGFVQYGQWKPNTMLKRFLSSLKMGGKLPKIIEDRCEMKHIISLWRVLNVEQARQITKGKEDPFPSVNIVFKEELDKDQLQLLTTNLGHYDIDQFLDVFYEFIVTHIKNCKENEADEMLVDSYLDVCDYFKLEVIAGFEGRFPPEFSMKHVTSIWKHAVMYQVDQQLKNH